LIHLRAIRAAVYARLSEDHERAESVPTQISNSTKHAKRMGWEVVSVFKDERRPGYSGEFRPGFEDMLTFLSKGGVQVLVARHHDRLTRNAEDFDRLMKICGKSKIKISTYAGRELDLSTASCGFYGFMVRISDQEPARKGRYGARCERRQEDGWRVKAVRPQDHPAGPWRGGSSWVAHRGLGAGASRGGGDQGSSHPSSEG
jgi:hypothetical protein